MSAYCGGATPQREHSPVEVLVDEVPVVVELRVGAGTAT